MRTLRSFFTLLCAAVLLHSTLEANPLKRFNFSFWTDYSGMELENLKKEEQTAKFQELFKDKMLLAKNYNGRKIMVLILNPEAYPFFNPDNFDANRDDNFFYWIMQLSKYGEVEAVFDGAPFHLSSYRWSDRLYDYAGSLLRIEKPLAPFADMVQKLTWVSLTNDLLEQEDRIGPVIKGVVIDPKGINDGTCQLLINMLDQYKYNAGEGLPENHFPTLRVGMSLSLDQKALAFCNLARFPLLTDIRSNHQNQIGLTPPSTFPSEGPSYLSPEWRAQNNAPLLDMVYIRADDRRLEQSIYQNYEALPSPEEPNTHGTLELVKNFAKNICGVPYVKGPGVINSSKGGATIEGRYTFFKTGDGKFRQGQFIEGGNIEVRPPYTDRIVRKTIAQEPTNNKQIKITSTFSTTKDVVNAEYYTTATPVSWSYPYISNAIRSKIYFVFSTTFEPEKGCFMGNWHLRNVLDFFHNAQHNTGFLIEAMFLDLNRNGMAPMNNLVLKGFPSIPNGHPYPECDWQLGNKTH